ncbi:MAG: protein translocase subunit SecD, partial [Cellulosilyticum sp.]|nr:protein translocase subunit SecD [Cellulosilyticum sp.]
MKGSKYRFFGVSMIVAVICFIALFGIGDQVKGVAKIRFGIDIRGGIEAVFEPEDLDRQPTQEELNAARNVIETRLDSKNILEREVTVDKQKGYIIVRFPWKSDETNFNPEAAIAELGETAQLTFRDEKGNVLIEGSHVKSSSPAFDQQQGEYIVQLSFDEEGSKLFEAATEKMIGKQMAIYMDDVVISAPLVQEKIAGGQCVINGMSNADEAKELSEKINAGALPFSMNTSNHSSISPTLGSDALKIMVVAGVVAFVIVCLFMIIYYRLSGAMSCIALCLQMALQLLAISAPQFTLTLPGIAGIILSLGMAVDANVIISERISEEIAKGMTIRQAIKKGYEKAFSSVFDGNFTSCIVAILLMIFGSGSMLSFGYTLLTGLVINFVAGVLTSKVLLSSIIMFKPMNHTKWFRKKKESPVIPFY